MRLRPGPRQKLGSDPRLGPGPWAWKQIPTDIKTMDKDIKIINSSNKNLTDTL